MKEGNHTQPLGANINKRRKTTSELQLPPSTTTIPLSTVFTAPLCFFLGVMLVRNLGNWILLSIALQAP